MIIHLLDAHLDLLAKIMKVRSYDLCGFNTKFLSRLTQKTSVILSIFDSLNVK